MSNDTCFLKNNRSLNAGDIESMPFMEALGQFSYRVGKVYTSRLDFLGATVNCSLGFADLELTKPSTF